MVNELLKISLPPVLFQRRMLLPSLKKVDVASPFEKGGLRGIIKTSFFCKL
jgi:hypothetical protein